MEIAGSIFAGLSVASMVVSSGITINLTENAGTLFQSGAIHVDEDDSKLHGKYAVATTGIAGATIGLASVYTGMYLYGLYKYSGHQLDVQQKIYWTILLIAMVMAVVSSALTLSLVNNFSTFLADGQLATNPAIVIPGENYQLRGAIGNGVFGMAVVTLLFASLGMIQMGVAWKLSKRTSIIGGNPVSPSINTTFQPEVTTPLQTVYGSTFQYSTI